MTVTLDDVRQYVSKEAVRRNGRMVPSLPTMMKKLVTDPHYYIFNVGPWAWSRQLGGRGTREVGACEEGQSFSEPLPMPILDNETVASDMNKMENRQEEGIEVVKAFMMQGYGFKPDDSLENWGVSVIDHWPPTAQDIAAANKRLNQKFDDLIAEADRFHENREHLNITDFHRLAARRRKQTKNWLNVNPDMKACPACGSTVMPDIAVCPHCSATLNEELARRFFPERYKKAS